MPAPRVGASRSTAVRKPNDCLFAALAVAPQRANDKSLLAVLRKPADVRATLRLGRFEALTARDVLNFAILIKGPIVLVHKRGCRAFEEFYAGIPADAQVTGRSKLHAQTAVLLAANVIPPDSGNDYFAKTALSAVVLAPHLLSGAGTRGGMHTTSASGKVCCGIWQLGIWRRLRSMPEQLESPRTPLILLLHNVQMLYVLL